MKNQYIDLKMPSIMGMGAVGPTLAVLTASLYSALMAAVEEPPHWAYPAIMLVLSGLLATFPVSKEKLPTWQRFVLWPIVAVIIFTAAWGTNHGLSVGEEALANGVENGTVRIPSLITTVYAQDTNVPPIIRPDAMEDVNAIDLRTVDFSSKKKPPMAVSNELEGVWGFRVGSTVYLRDKDAKWWTYRFKPKPPPVPLPPPRVDLGHQPDPPPQQQMPGGFFKRWPEKSRK